VKLKLSIVCDNTAGSSCSLLGEHGLAIWVHGREQFLFDTGQGLALRHNLEVLQLPVHDLTRVVLSHGHYDHGGGLRDLLALRTAAGAKKTEICLQPGAFTKRYSVRQQADGSTSRISIGLPFSRREYEAAGAVFRETSGYEQLTAGVWAFSDIPRPPDWRCFDTRLMVDGPDGTLIPDPFPDDLSLLLETDSGPVILLGCAHAGMVEILEFISAQTGLNEFYAVIGGTHLGKGSRSDRHRALRCLEKFKVKQICPCHCTGFPAACSLAGYFGERFIAGCAGTVLAFPGFTNASG
jgi:7,8-dihydropterin-6-yl-methyl-4-(beta-D-ribofuranosyl)aminobenzene 5'-phosphate synthase